MKIVIFSGTTEGRLLSERLAADGVEVHVCVASEYGRDLQGTQAGIRVLQGPLSETEKAGLLKDAGICVDATHPYASHVTESVRKACEKAGVPYLRVLRRACPAENAVEVENAAAAAAWLAGREGNILLTTGAKELQDFRSLDKNRLFPRVLPTADSLNVCRELGIPTKNIIAMQGPFSKELNEALIRQFQIAYLVSKDGGAPGGFPEKAAAAAAAGAQLVVLKRPQEEGMDLEEVLAVCRKQLAL